MENTNNDLVIFAKKLPIMSTKKVIDFIHVNDPFNKFLSKMVDYNYKNNSLIIQFSNKLSMDSFICEFFNFYKDGTNIELYYFGEKCPIEKKLGIIIDLNYSNDNYKDIVYPYRILTYKNHLDADIKSVLKINGTNVINKYMHYDSDKELFVLKSPNKKGWLKYELIDFIYQIIHFMYHDGERIDFTEFVRICGIRIDSDKLYFEIVIDIDN